MFESCLIRKMIEDDLPLVLAWRNHPEVNRYMFKQHQITLAEHCEWFVKASLDSSRCLMIVQEGKQAIGYVHFSNVNDNGVANWGFYRRPDASKGEGLKLGVTALNYAFNYLKLHKVCGQALAGNRVSIEFHQRLGFVAEGILRDQQLIEGIYHNLHCFGILAKEWKIEKFGR